MAKPKVAVIGTGYWGKNLVRTFDGLDVLAACCDLDEGRLRKIGAANGSLRLTTDIGEILSDRTVEAIAIATPGPTHFEIARRCLEAGRHVFVEKPITLSVADAESLVSLSEQNRKVLMVGHLLLYHPAVRKLKQLIETRELGDLYYIYSQRLNLGKVRPDENAMWNFAPHDISVILYLFEQKPVNVSVRGACYIQRDKKIEDVVFMNMQFRDGKAANVHISWLDPHKMRKMTIVGSQKMVIFDDVEPAEKIRIYDKGVSSYNGAEYSSYGESLSIRSGDITIPAVQMKEPLLIECEHFLDCILNNKRPLSDGRNGTDVLRVLEAAQASMEKNGIPVDTGL